MFNFINLFTEVVIPEEQCIILTDVHNKSIATVIGGNYQYFTIKKF